MWPHTFRQKIQASLACTQEAIYYRVLNSKTHQRLDSFTLELDTRLPYIERLRSVLMELKKLKHRPLIVGLPQSEVLSVKLELESPLRDSELRVYLKENALSLLGHEASELCLDFKATLCPNTQRTSVCVVAAPRRLIACFLKLKPKAIDSEAYAIARALLALNVSCEGVIHLNKHSVLTITDIHKDCLTVTVFKSENSLHENFDQALSSLSLALEKVVLSGSNQLIQSLNIHSDDFIRVHPSSFSKDIEDSTPFLYSYGTTLWGIRP